MGKIRARRASDELKQHLVYRYELGCSIMELGEHFGYSRAAIHQWFKDMGVKTRSRRETRMLAVRRGRQDGVITRDAHHGLFDELNDDSAYILGLLATDGCVSGRTVRLSLVDRQLVGEVGRYLGDGLHITEANINKRPQYSIQVSSPHMVERLAFWGVGERKSLTLEWPDHLPEQLYPHYVRGVFDGDGSATMMQPYGAKRISFVGGSEPYLIGLGSYLNANGINTSKIYVDNRSKNPSYCIRVDANQSVRDFAQLIYGQMHSQLYLARKKERLKWCLV